MRVFLDTNVILRAMRVSEGASPELIRLVREGSCRRGAVQVAIVAPVITELLLTSERHEPFARETLSLLDRVRQARSSPAARESPALDALRDGLDSAFKAYEDARADHYREAQQADTALATHAIFPSMPAGLLTTAHDLEKKLTEAGAPRVGRRDLLILAAVRATMTTGDVFLTSDGRLSDAAKSLSLDTRDPEAFANAQPETIT